MTNLLPSGDVLRDAAAGVHEDVIELRREIHKDPELGLDLPRTQDRVLESLTGLGLEITTGETSTSVVADLDSGSEGPIVLLRADMDALPMTEDLDVPFQSTHEGRMHACGHDGHTAMLVGAARILAEQRSELTGRVRFMFQPGEEGHHGARHMIEEGVLDGVDRAFAIHVTPNIPTGMAATRRGPLMASADTFHLTVHGTGGHASTPHFTDDPIPAAAAIVTGLHTMVTRSIDVNQPGLITVAHIEAGTTTNVIPETAFVEGTIRALNEHSRTTLHEGVQRVAHGMAAADGCSCTVDIEPGYPVTVNNDDQADLVSTVASHTLGEELFVTMPTPIMGAEDWSYVLQQVPGAMAFLGVCPDDIDDPRKAPSNHSNYMRLNEDALANGVALYCSMAMAVTAMVDVSVINEVVQRHWNEALPVLEDYIRIPAKSPAFDPDWETSGHLAEAVDLIERWCVDHAPEGASVFVHDLAGRTPVIVVDVPATPGIDRPDTVLLYGHLDKQPEMTGWHDGFGPWTPVVEDDRLYGRGGGDDGYAAFAIMCALDAVRSSGGGHQRCVALIEASEESGSPDLPAHLEALTERLGDISLVICLDSGAPDYDAMWMTTSLRGLIQAELRVDVLERGMHSGIVGGAAPSSLRVLRQLLDRIEDPETGGIRLDAFHVDIPGDRRAEAEAAAAAGVDPRVDIAFAGTTRSDAPDAVEAQLSINWRPSMASIGIDGVPSLADAGNVLRPHTSIGLSFRLPPTCDPDAAIAALRAAVESDPPSGATVTLTVHEAAPGWNAAMTEPWLQAALDEASLTHFGRPTGAWGIGGSIPFMAMLGERYPDAQFVITGVLGPESNAHGPNEFLHLPTARRISACMAHVLDAHARR